VIREIFSLFQEKNKTEFKKISESEKWFGKFGIKTSLEKRLMRKFLKSIFYFLIGEKDYCIFLSTLISLNSKKIKFLIKRKRF